MKSHAGLTKKVIAVKGKKGIVKRSYWVKAKEAVSGMAKRQGQRTAAAYKKGSVRASAGTGFRMGALAGLAGGMRGSYNRTSKVAAGVHAASQLVAAGTRRATGTQGKSIGKKLLHGASTYAGTVGGMLAGHAAHSLARAGIKAGVNAIRNRRKSA